MFCSRCGTKSSSEFAKFCSKCGCPLKNDSADKEKTPASSTCGFMEFKRRKEEERRSKEPKGKRPKLNPKPKAEQEVEIKVGVMRYDGILKKCRGKLLPVTTKPLATAKQIKEKAIRKHVDHDKSMHEKFEYVLLYPDGSEVIYLPGTQDAFCLEKYKNEIKGKGKSFSQVTLYLCTKTDFLFSEAPTFDIDESDDEVIEGLKVESIDCSSGDEDLLQSPFQEKGEKVIFMKYIVAHFYKRTESPIPIHNSTKYRF